MSWSRFPSSTSPTSPVALSGLDSGDAIAGIDFRPATLQLYGLGTSGQLYRIDTFTDVATAIGSPLTLDGSTTYDIDFDPTLDQLHVLSAKGSDVTVDPDTGAVLASSTLKSFGSAAVAYTHDYPASQTYPTAPSTKQLEVDATAGTLDAAGTAIGSLGVSVSSAAGFDVSTSSDGSTDTGYAVLTPQGGNQGLYSIDLSSGAATGLGTTGGTLTSIAVAPDAPAFVTLNSGSPQTLSLMPAASDPGVVTSGVAVTGLASGEHLVAIATSPFTGILYGLGSTGILYILDARSGQAYAVNGSPFSAPSSAATGFTFDPLSDPAAIRLLDGASNATIAADTGALTQGTALAYASGDANASATPDVGGATYLKGGGLLDIDTGLGVVATQSGATLSTVGDLGVTASGVGGFDAVARFNQQFAVLQVGGRSTLYAVDAAGQAGAATKIGAIGVPSGTTVQGLAEYTVNSASAVPGAYYTIPSQGGSVRPRLRRSVHPRRDRKAPFDFRVKGSVTLCNGGVVRITVTRHRSGKRVLRKAVVLNAKCRFHKRLRLRVKTIGRHGRLDVHTRFLGTAGVDAVRGRRLVVRYG